MNDLLPPVLHKTPCYRFGTGEKLVTSKLKDMKAHRFKSKLTTQDEVWEEFNSQLYPKIDKAVFDKIGHNKGILAYAEFKQSTEGVKLVADVKLSLIKEWERKGRNMAFLKNEFEFSFMNLLNQKYYGKPLE